MLTWASPFNICCFLDNHAYGSPSHRFECLLAVGAVDRVRASAGNALQQVKDFSLRHKDWLFGHFAYDLVHETEPMHHPGAFPSLPDPIGFPDLFFFLPEVVIELRSDSIRIGSLHSDPPMIWEQIRCASPMAASPGSPPLHFTPRFTREAYLDTITALQRHILRGDCYEINFCQEFFARPADIDPWQTWWALSGASPNPFSALYRLEDSYLICASPERYLKKTGRILLSQPIKGTSSRIPGDPVADAASREGLFRSPKDRSENVMVVDLVRNDLSKVCRPGTVAVNELYGIYPFPQVHQMISSVQGELLPDRHWVEAIQATFPMGSMTGAPKYRVASLIAQYERSRRGIFSGAIGYVTPEEDFDFNVVIRSLLYNSHDRYLSYQVGSGITFYSDPEAEYAECLIKAEGIKKALGI